MHYSPWSTLCCNTNILMTWHQALSGIRETKRFFLLYCTVPNFIGSTTALICPWRASNVWVHWVSEAQKHFLFLARTASIVVGTEVTQSAAPCCEPPQRRRWGWTWSADFWVSKQRRRQRWRWTLSSLWWDDRGLEAQGGLSCNAANSDRLFTPAKVVVWDALSLCVSVVASLMCRSRKLKTTAGLCGLKRKKRNRNHHQLQLIGCKYKENLQIFQGLVFVFLLPVLLISHRCGTLFICSRLLPNKTFCPVDFKSLFKNCCLRLQRAQLKTAWFTLKSPLTWGQQLNISSPLSPPPH